MIGSFRLLAPSLTANWTGRQQQRGSNRVATVKKR
jgi:hypothetical protein